MLFACLTRQSKDEQRRGGRKLDKREKAKNRSEQKRESEREKEQEEEEAVKSRKV